MSTARWHDDQLDLWTGEEHLHPLEAAEERQQERRQRQLQRRQQRGPRAPREQLVQVTAELDPDEADQAAAEWHATRAREALQERLRPRQG